MHNRKMADLRQASENKKIRKTQQGSIKKNYFSSLETKAGFKKKSQTGGQYDFSVL
jgi:hypothetical protein